MKRRALLLIVLGLAACARSVVLVPPDGGPGFAPDASLGDAFIPDADGNLDGGPLPDAHTANDGGGGGAHDANVDAP